MALILAIETATRRCSIALSQGTELLAYREEEGERLTHAEHLNVFVDAVLREAGVEMRALGAVAVGIGPGSYTGLRIGLSAAKGLCYALEFPLIGMETLDVLVQELVSHVHDLPANAVLMPMVDARRMEVFTLEASIDATHLTEAQPLVLDESWCASRPAQVTTVVFGDGADKAAMLWEGRSQIRYVPGIRPAHCGLSRLAGILYSKGAFSDLAYLVPNYGKPANVTQPRKAGA